MSAASKGFDLSRLDLPALQHLNALLPHLIALRELVEPKGGAVRVSLNATEDLWLTPHSALPDRLRQGGAAGQTDTETVAPMQTPPQGAAATDDPVGAGVAAPVAAGHPLPAVSSPDAVKPAPAAVSPPAAGASGRLAAWLDGVSRRGPWTVEMDAALMRLVVRRWKVGEIAADLGIDGAQVGARIKVLTDKGKWRADAVLHVLQAMVSP